MSDLAARIQAIEDRLAIAELQARYTILIDNQDIEHVAPLFAHNGRFRSADGMMDAQGRNAICDQYRGRFSALRFSFHVTHDHWITLDPADPCAATGIVSSHAEVVRNGQPMVVGMRYHDAYAREEGAWRFADRLLHFFYYMPVEYYAAVLPTPHRMCAYGDARPADMPEGAIPRG